MKGEAAFLKIANIAAEENMIRIIENDDQMAAFVFAHAGNDENAVKLALQMDKINKGNVRKYLSMTGEELESLPEDEKYAIKKDGEEYARLFKEINAMHIVEDKYFEKNQKKE